jgi:prepilin-type N-terminal cleavage/methylation domain-containing protein
MKNSQKGFTLIELLVVIAIIGILSSVVLAALTTARTKGKDASVQTQLSNMRSQAELYFSSNSSNYGGYLAKTQCSTATSTNIFGSANTGSLKNLLAGVLGNVAASDTACAVGNITESAGNGSSWAVAAKSLSDTSKIICVDSSGVSKTAAGSSSLAVVFQTSTSTRCAN